MSPKVDPARVDQAIKLYLAGEPMQKIHSATGVSSRVLYRERSARGIPSRRWKDLPIEQVVASYQAGASEYALGRQYGVSRNVIARRLEEFGVDRRGPSEAGLVRAAQMTSGARKEQAAAANRAARMRRVGQVDKHRRALAIEAASRHDSPAEQRLAELLVEREVFPAVQRAVGVYNVDLAVLPVAVEVVGGSPAVRAHYAERTPYILDEGWHLVLVRHGQGRWPIDAGAADYLIAFFEEMGRNPPATCQYRVITGQGKVLAARGREDNEFPLVPSPRRR